jgi:hypothetical protein
MQPNDPFDQSNQSDPYVNPNEPGVPTKKKGRGCMWAVIGVLGFGFVSLLVCCGGVYFIGTNYSGLVYVDSVNGMPQVTDRVGKVESMNVNFGETINQAQNYPEHIVFDVSGTQGTASLLIKPGDDGSLEAAYLIEESGEIVEIDLAGSSNMPIEVNLPEVPGPGDSESAVDDQPTTEAERAERELRELESELGISSQP